MSSSAVASLQHSEHIQARLLEQFQQIKHTARNAHGQQGTVGQYCSEAGAQIRRITKSRPDCNWTLVIHDVCYSNLLANKVPRGSYKFLYKQIFHYALDLTEPLPNEKSEWNNHNLLRDCYNMLIKVKFYTVSLGSKSDGILSMETLWAQMCIALQNTAMQANLWLWFFNEAYNVKTKKYG